MVKALMDRSLANEEEEEEKEEARRAARKLERASGDPKASTGAEDGNDSNYEASEITLESEEDSDSMTMGSFVKVDEEKKRDAEVCGRIYSLA
jgi:hypothetical protein